LTTTLKWSMRDTDASQDDPLSCRANVKALHQQERTRNEGQSNPTKCIAQKVMIVI